MNLLAELRGRFRTVLAAHTDDPDTFLAMIRPAADPKFGDYQANFAMPLGKTLSRNPRELAAEIAAAVELGDLCELPEVAGPGFINLRIRDDRLSELSNRLVPDERLGVTPVESPRTVVVDFSAPNVAKPMHVGHLRSTVIGDALYRILKFLGHRVIGDNHIGDWGTQFGMIIFGYKHFLDSDHYAADPVGELSRLYRLVNQLSDYHGLRSALPQLQKSLQERQTELKAHQAAADPADKKAKKEASRLRTEVQELQAKIDDAQRRIGTVDSDPRLSEAANRFPDIAVRARQETAKLHAGDPENRQLWETFLPQCLDALNRVYDRLDIHFDMTLGESWYDPMLASVVGDLQQRNLARVSDGAVCVFIQGNEAPLIVRKEDGAFTYATTDLATVQYRVEKLNADLILYVVDARQSEHFRLLFETARRWGHTQAEYRHISFGTILGDDRRPFKTRSGDTVGLESLLDEAVARARRIIDENDEARGGGGADLDETTRQQVAEAVGIGGIKYADLRHNRESDYVFSWEKMLATTGDTATYMQYAYARIAGILRRGGVDRSTLRTSGATLALSHPEERRLALQINRFAETLTEVVSDFRPNILTSYLFETANRFSTFYNECPVLQADSDEQRTSRLLLCDLTARVLEQGLSLLGIRACEQM